MFLLCYNDMTFNRNCGENGTPSSGVSTSVFMLLSYPVHKNLSAGIKHRLPHERFSPIVGQLLYVVIRR